MSDDFDYFDAEVILCLLAIGCLILLNYFFWFNSESEQTTFDAHGLSGWYYLIDSVVLIEILFLIFITQKAKPSSQSWTEFALLNKLKSAGMIFLFWTIVVPVGWIIAEAIKGIIGYKDAIYDKFIIGVAFLVIIGIVIIYCLLNIGLARIISKEEPAKKNKKETKQ